ncbi:sigma-E processing peptidase SpoIIGA [Pseudalkalibacillus caeni]|uniref:Sporulation sigma-E factor-processing peptidase n=1 Tax=Exobacillus caeni TaxID=2574798 RepID=A0A5R9EWN8_9BACL|nr:sigma-E processing peptidase SpoIIGA [Pseudalkalibacillus caeni]TLS35251.1 sigma-E processing peptidase SpoIIGA [Pseudalkalibacillus caeni]
MTVYLDVIWFLNFCFDFLLLLLTGLLLKRRMKKRRIMLGAFIASLYVLFLFIPTLSILTLPASKLVYSLAIAWSAFGYYRFRYFIQNWLMFYLVTFLVGGGLMGTHYFLQSDFEIIQGVAVTHSTGFGDPVSWVFVILGFPIIWYFSKQRLDHLEARKIHYDQIANVKINVDGITLEAAGLIDSGNQLHDPISRLPVMILDVSKFASALPAEIVEMAQDYTKLGENEGTQPWEERIRLIPYRAVGQDNQFMLALKPDLVTIEHSDETINVKKVLIGLSYRTLSGEDEYDCILHPKMMVSASNQTAS